MTDYEMYQRLSRVETPIETVDQRLVSNGNIIDSVGRGNDLLVAEPASACSW